MDSNTKIRFASTEDVNRIIDLCEEHANFEKAEYNKEGKSKILAKDLFDENPKLYCLVVENGHKIIGYATYMKQYSTWEASDYIYMDCLYIIESARSRGFGEDLINRIKKEGQNLGCRLIQWQTPDFNTRAIKFYERIGAFSKSKERFYLKIKL